VSSTCTFSIIIPVLHESAIINTLLDSLRRLEHDTSFEIIVVDGSTTQDTLQVISDATVKKYACPQGRGRQMNEGATHATGELLIFLHADTFLQSDALSLIRSTLANKRFVGGAFTLRIHPQTRFLKMIAAYTTLRSQISRAPYGDQVIFLRKTYFEEIGGYADIPLMEDVELMRRIKKKKGKILILPDPVFTSDRRWHQEGTLYTLLRDNIIIILYWFGMPVEKLARFYPWQKPEEETKGKTLIHQNR
jgi:rSAM/selenodomain-associated transferase 2